MEFYPYLTNTKGNYFYFQGKFLGLTEGALKWQSPNLSSKNVSSCAKRLIAESYHKAIEDVFDRRTTVNSLACLLLPLAMTPSIANGHVVPFVISLALGLSGSVLCALYNNKRMKQYLSNQTLPSGIANPQAIGDKRIHKRATELLCKQFIRPAPPQKTIGMSMVRSFRKRLGF